MSKYVRDKEQRDDKTETIEWAQRIHEKRQAWVSKLRPPSSRLPLGRDHVSSFSHGIRNFSPCGLHAMPAKISVHKQQVFACDSYRNWPCSQLGGFSPLRIKAGCRDLLGNRMQLIGHVGIFMKFVVSTHVPDAGSCSHLSCWTEAHPALWRELTSTRTSIWLSRQQLLPTSWPNKWVILEADH